uniref:Uncharacterized protein n=1 Tax=Cacopsylla melanoneura TaxID=428564 RepID=A0A8D9FCT5_9HEMI
MVINLSFIVCQSKFPGCLICLGGDLPWSARSPDLAPCNYIYCGLKAEVYKDRPRTLEELKNNTRREIDRIPIEMLTKVNRNFRNRLRQCIDSNGRHLNGVLFEPV